MKILYKLLFLTFFLTSWTLHAQKDLPHYLTIEEIIATEQDPPIASSSGPVTTLPPLTKARSMAEWEEIQSLVVVWTNHIPVVRNIIKYAKEECEVIVICIDSVSVKNNLASFNITTQNISFLQKPFNSIWIRDYGQNTIYLNDVDSLKLVDWIYNRPRFLDNVLPTSVSDFKNLSLHTTTQLPNDLVHTGGNYMSDGLGTAFSSNLILKENGPDGKFNPSVKTSTEIDSVMKRFMGIERYIKLDTLLYDRIHHIDMHMKLLDEETLLFGEYPSGVADGPQIEANIQYIQNNFTSSFGTPYRIVRMPMPPDAFNRYPDNNGHYRTYANSVFVNKTILVPIYEEQYDTTAIRIWKETMPGYKVVGINCNSIIPSFGALHCITKAIGVADPLRIVHQPLRDSAITYSSTYNISATVQHQSGIATATLHYTTDTAVGYTAIPMSLTNATTDTWSAQIPFSADGVEVFYYIEGIANSGKRQVRPMPAPAGFWHFKVKNLINTQNRVDEELLISKVFPNPSFEKAFINIKSNTSKKIEIQLYNTIGQLLTTVFQGNINSGMTQYVIQTGHLPKGAYLVRLKSNNAIQTQTLIVD